MGEAPVAVPRTVEAGGSQTVVAPAQVPDPLPPPFPPCHPNWPGHLLMEKGVGPARPQAGATYPTRCCHHYREQVSSCSTENPRNYLRLLPFTRFFMLSLLEMDLRPFPLGTLTALLLCPVLLFCVYVYVATDKHRGNLRMFLLL